MEDKNLTTEENSNYEAEQNLLGVFAILLAVDRRINPQNYEWLNKKEND